MFGYEYESYLQLASLNTNKKKNEFDLALEKVRKEEKYLPVSKIDRGNSRGILRLRFPVSLSLCSFDSEVDMGLKVPVCQKKRPYE